MIQTYLSIEASFVWRHDLGSVERANIIRGVMAKMRDSVMAELDSPKAAARSLSIVLSGEEGSETDGRVPIGESTLVWPNGDYEEHRLWYDRELHRIVDSRPIVTRPGR